MAVDFKGVHQTRVQIAKLLKVYRIELQQAGSRLNNLEKKDKTGWQPRVNTLPSKYIFFPVSVTSVSTSNCLFYGHILEPNTETCSPWTLDTSLTTPITVSVVDPSSMPDVGDIVRADFTGTYSTTPVARYGLFDRFTTVTSDNCWLGVTGKYIEHLQSYTKTTVASCGVLHGINDAGVIRWVYDDAMHLVGFYTCGYTWNSPNGITEPVYMSVTGTLSPDSTGDYYESGIYDGKKYYQRGVDSWYIWYDSEEGEESWFISKEVGAIPDNESWYNDSDADSPSTDNPYSPHAGATGDATVTASA